MATSTYTVRRPGCTAWSEGHRTLASARRAQERANRDMAPGHLVFRDGAEDEPLWECEWRGAVPTVTDPTGGVWWPSEEAREEIGRCPEPSERAIEMAREEPLRGEWHQ